MIDMIKKFKSENIKFVCPLSYGNFEYRDKVIEYGKNILGDKFCPITEYMPQQEYYSLLNKCSVGIFNNNRQQAMGNINVLLRFGAKVYIRDDTTMWNTFSNQRSYHLF